MGTLFLLLSINVNERTKIQCNKHNEKERMFNRKRVFSQDLINKLWADIVVFTYITFILRNPYIINRWRTGYILVGYVC